MEQENVGLYLGMDISEKYTMISIYQQHMKEPQTVSYTHLTLPTNSRV